MLNSVLALHAVGFAVDHPVMVTGLQGVARSVTPEYAQDAHDVYGA